MSTEDRAPGFIDNRGNAVRAPKEIRPGTAALIFNEQGEVLLHKRSDNGFWSVPGGAVDIGESVQQAIVREALEETGLHVTVKRLIGIYSDPKHYTISTYPGGDVVQRRLGFVRVRAPVG